MNIKEVILHHNNCHIPKCFVCISSADNLEKYLHQEIDTENKIDVLGKYRSWLDFNDIISENESGWILPSAYEHTNIKSFIRDYKSGTDYSRKHLAEIKKKEELLWILKNKFCDFENIGISISIEKFIEDIEGIEV